MKHLSAEGAQEGEGHGITLPSAVGLMYTVNTPLVQNQQVKTD